MATLIAQKKHFPRTRIEHLASLDVKHHSNPIRLSGIICTIGPACAKVEILEEMIQSGMGVARLNLSHGTHEAHAEYIRLVREAVSNLGKRNKMTVPVAIALDTKGPEIRTGFLEAGQVEVEVKRGATIKLTTNKDYTNKCSAQILYVDYEKITETVFVGSKLFIEDGLILVIVKEIGDDYLICQVENDGHLRNKKCVNLPGTPLELPAVSEEDKKDLLFGVEQGVDLVLASFVRNAAGVKETREVLGEKGKHILVISKIEDHEGMENLDEIIAESDGIQIGRGDLATEYPPEKVSTAQKAMVARCNIAGKAVICATQILDSMLGRPRPTRAEGSDVSNAILDGVDCVQLSGETARGHYPVECVKTLDNMCREAEALVWRRQEFKDLVSVVEEPVADGLSVCIAVVEAAYNSRASAIIVLTTTGNSAQLVAKYRPPCPVIAVTRDIYVARQCRVRRGILPVHYPYSKPDSRSQDVREREQYALGYGRLCEFISDGDRVVIVTGWHEGSGSTNTMRVKTVEQGDGVDFWTQPCVEKTELGRIS